MFQKIAVSTLKRIRIQQFFRKNGIIIKASDKLKKTVGLPQALYENANKAKSFHKGF